MLTKSRHQQLDFLNDLRFQDTSQHYPWFLRKCREATSRPAAADGPVAPTPPVRAMGANSNGPGPGSACTALRLRPPRLASSLIKLRLGLWPLGVFFTCVARSVLPVSSNPFRSFALQARLSARGALLTLAPSQEPRTTSTLAQRPASPAAIRNAAT